jgi:toxin ParE1/3/4
MPFIGSPRSFPSTRLHNLRQWPVKGFKEFLIFYHVVNEGIEVLRILHARRNIEAVFEEQD